MVRTYSKRLFCTLEEGEKIFGIAKTSLCTLAQADAIPATRAPFGKRWLIDISKMKAFLAARAA